MEIETLRSWIDHELPAQFVRQPARIPCEPLSADSNPGSDSVANAGTGPYDGSEALRYPMGEATRIHGARQTNTPTFRPGLRLSPLRSEASM